MPCLYAALTPLLAAKAGETVATECSVVIPLCNEQQNLPALHLRLAATMRRLAIPYEIIYVDDGSTDHTASLIRELAQEDRNVRGILLSRNFGHQSALCAGLEAATGRAVVTMDGDLQDPPELLPQMIERWREGAQIVFAQRRRRREMIVKRFAYFAFYRLLRMISDTPIELDTGDFALMDRRALDELNAMPERTRFIRGLRTWVGFAHARVEYDRDPRQNGKTKYTFRRLIRLAKDGIFSFSQLPLRMLTTLGLAMTGLSVLAITAGGVSGLLYARNYGILLGMGGLLGMIGGVQLVGLGIVGEYLSRVYDEVRGRPMYVVRETLGFESLPRPVPNVFDFLSNQSEQPRERKASRMSPDWADALHVGDGGPSQDSADKLG